MDWIGLYYVYTLDECCGVVNELNAVPHVTILFENCWLFLSHDTTNCVYMRTKLVYMLGCGHWHVHIIPFFIKGHQTLVVPVHCRTPYLSTYVSFFTVVLHRVHSHQGSKCSQLWRRPGADEYLNTWSECVPWFPCLKVISRLFWLLDIMLYDIVRAKHFQGLIVSAKRCVIEYSFLV